MASAYVTGYNASYVPQRSKILTGTSLSDILTTDAPSDTDIGGLPIYHGVLLDSGEAALRGIASVDQAASMIAALSTNGILVARSAKTLKTKVLDNTFSGSAYDAINAPGGSLKLRLFGFRLQNLDATNPTDLTLKNGAAGTTLAVIRLVKDVAYIETVQPGFGDMVLDANTKLSMESSANVRVVGRILYYEEA